MRNNEPQYKAVTGVRELDNKDIAEVGLTDCQGKEEVRAQMVVNFVNWVPEEPSCQNKPEESQAQVSWNTGSIISLILYCAGLK